MRRCSIEDGACRRARWLLLACLGSFPAIPRAAAAADDAAGGRVHGDTVDVIGYRRETRPLERPGRSAVIRPEGATRFDLVALLAPIASLSLPETGRLNASGFAIPRVRGQDGRFTEIYVEDLLLQDPYLGLPLVDDLDLRAFGELSIHRGLPPAFLPTMNPIGVLQYRLRPVARSGVQVGAETGRPYGTSLWTSAALRSGDSPDKDQALTARVYARRHVTDGRYPYYSDNATPFNVSDDQLLTRTGNHRASSQLLPYIEFVHGADRLRLLGLWQHSTNGIPSRLPRQDDAAHEVTSNNLGAASWSRTLERGKAAHIPHHVSLTLAANEDRRRIDDPAFGIVGARGNASTSVSGRKGLVTGSWGRDDSPVRASLTAVQPEAWGR